MENLVTHAWVNGQWTAQTISREQLMAQNQQYESNEFSNLPVTETPAPIYGLLTRTLVHSPVIKQIIPARVRSRDLNDVVFVGETFIELHLLTEDGKLRQVGTKTDFQADIRHARVFGSPRRHFYSAQDAIFKQELASQLQDDDVMHGEGDIKPMLPPHILALTLDSGHLAFVYAKSAEEQGEVHFIVSTKRIESKGVHPTHLGRSIAVDPRSRALAVCAYQDSFRMYALYPIEELEQQLQDGMHLNPIKEERTFHVKGVILHMEFLHASPGDLDHVILLLFLIDSNQTSRLQIFEWCTTKSLHTATKHGHHGLRLSEDITMPLHIIPLVISSAFLLVTEYSTHVVKASDIMSGNAAFPKIAFPPSPPSGHRRSLVTSWARPLRTPNYAYDHDDMYLSMEDGDIYFLEVDTQGPNLIQLANKACHLDCAIGTAFASLDFGLTKNDMLIAGGEMSSGGVYLLKIGPSPVEIEPKLEESVANWSPVFDFELVNVPAQGNGIAERDRVFACTGRGEHGAITELRYGIQARIQGAAEYDQGVKWTWVLPDLSGKGYFLLSSLADQSRLCFLTPAGDWEDATELEFLDMNEATLAAGRIGQQSLQITPSAINLTRLKGSNLSIGGDPSRDMDMLDGEDLLGGAVLRRKCDGGDVIIAAATKGVYVVLAIRSGPLVRLTLATILIDGESEDFLNPIGMPTDLSGDPTFVTILEFNGRVLAVVGTRQATIQIFLFDDLNGLVPLLEKSMIEGREDICQPDLSICESVVLLTTSNAAKLLCGLRGGVVIALDACWDYGLALERSKEIRFGPMPVQLHPDIHRGDSAFVLAGPELYRFDMPRGEFRASQVIFEQSNTEPSLVAFAQVDNSPDPENIVICVTKDQIFYADIGDSEKVCVRRLCLFETPRRLLFYRPLNLLIVACSRNPFDDARIDPEIVASGKKRTTFCSLKFLDPRTGESRWERDAGDTTKKDFFGKANEQIYCLQEWNVNVENKSYRYLAIGTSYINVTTSNIHKGRVIILSVIPGPIGTFEIRKRFQILAEAPVYSLAPYGNNSLVFCSGNKLYMRTLNIATKRFESIAEAKLRSPAVQISVAEPLIHLSCGSDSMFVLKFENLQLRAAYSDEVSRNGFHHVQILDNFFLATDKQYGVVGLWQPPGHRNVEGMVTVFEAELTSSISRIRRGNVRPPWHLGRSLPGVIRPEQDLVGSGVDGSMFHFTLLEENALKLLKHIQEIYRRKAEVCRYTPITSNDEERDPRSCHVDGDILASIVNLGKEWLRRVAINSEDGNTLLTRLREFVGNVLEIRDDEDPVEVAINYMRDLVVNGVVL